MSTAHGGEVARLAGGTARTHITSSEHDRRMLERATAAFLAATPKAGADVSDFREGFETMCSEFEVSVDADTEPVEANGVPCIKVKAPGVRDDVIILHFHSGGYMWGSARGYRNFGYRLSATAGVSVVLVDYRLAPENKYPAALDDALAAYEWAVETVGGSDRVFISGDSAGGGLAAATLLKLRDEGRPAPAGGVLISALLDRLSEGESLTTNAATDPVIANLSGNREQLARAYAGDVDPRSPYLSPLRGSKHNLPPILIMASEAEVFRDDSVRFAREVREAGGRAEEHFPAAMIHIWTLFPYLPQAQSSLEIAGDFIRGRLAELASQ